MPGDLRAYLQDTLIYSITKRDLPELLAEIKGLLSEMQT